MFRHGLCGCSRSAGGSGPLTECSEPLVSAKLLWVLEYPMGLWSLESLTEVDEGTRAIRILGLALFSLRTDWFKSLWNSRRSVIIVNLSFRKCSFSN